jgi:hypothetical protein
MCASVLIATRLHTAGVAGASNRFAGVRKDGGNFSRAGRTRTDGSYPKTNFWKHVIRQTAVVGYSLKASLKAMTT